MLIDSHIHIALDGIDIKATKSLGSLDAKKSWVRKILKCYKEKKIFAIRDGGDFWGFSSITREVAKEEGIIYKTPLYALYKKGHYGAFLGKAIIDLADFRLEFEKLVALRPDHLKIPLTGLVRFDQYGQIGPVSFTRKELIYMTEAAHDQGLPVMVHANGEEAVQMAIEAGVDTLEHGYYITERELQGLAEKNIVWVPTLAPLGNLVKKRDVRFLEELPTIEKIYCEHQILLRRAVDLGVRVAVGSDAGACCVQHGSGFFDEVDHMVKAGLTEKKVYEMADENGMRALQIKEEEMQRIRSEVEER